MSAVLACGRWRAVVRLGLAPRWHQLARYLLGIIRTQNGWNGATNRAGWSDRFARRIRHRGQDRLAPEMRSDTLCVLDGLRGLHENDAFKAQSAQPLACARCLRFVMKNP